MARVPTGLEKRASKGRTRAPVAARRFGYAIGLVANIVLIVITVNVVDWGWPAFITDDFESLTPIIVFSLVLSSAVNLTYFFHDPLRWKAVGDAITAVAALAVVWRALDVFPLRFESGPWAGVTRVIMIVACVGLVASLIDGAVKLTRGDFAETP